MPAVSLPIRPLWLWRMRQAEIGRPRLVIAHCRPRRLPTYRLEKSSCRPRLPQFRDLRGPKQQPCQLHLRKPPKPVSSKNRMLEIELQLRANAPLQSPRGLLEEYSRHLQASITNRNCARECHQPCLQAYAGCSTIPLLQCKPTDGRLETNYGPDSPGPRRQGPRRAAHEFVRKNARCHGGLRTRALFRDRGSKFRSREMVSGCRRTFPQSRLENESTRSGGQTGRAALRNERVPGRRRNFICSDSRSCARSGRELSCGRIRANPRRRSTSPRRPRIIRRRVRSHAGQTTPP